MRNHDAGYAQNLDEFKVWRNYIVEIRVAMLDANTFKPALTKYFLGILMTQPMKSRYAFYKE
jgi:hypothetical protein